MAHTCRHCGYECHCENTIDEDLINCPHFIECSHIIELEMTFEEMWNEADEADIKVVKARLEEDQK